MKKQHRHGSHGRLVLGVALVCIFVSISWPVHETHAQDTPAPSAPQPTLSDEPAAKIATPEAPVEEITQPAPLPEAASTQSVQQPAQPSDAVTAPAEPAPVAEENSNGINEKVLESPTRSIEAYEVERKKLLYQASIPTWAINLNIAYHAFADADLRVSTKPRENDLVGKPKLSGILLSYERYLINSFGLFALGVEGGGYGSPPRDRFKDLLFAFQTVGPFVEYQLNFIQRQWVVPLAKLEYEFVRYSYTFRDGHQMNETKIRGFKRFPRAELGALLFLNFLEPTASGSMSANSGVKRTYLGFYYSMAKDSEQKDFNLTDQAFRVGLKFEL